MCRIKTIWGLTEMNCDQVLAELESISDPEAVKKMARFGITARSALGVSIPDLRKMARNIGKDHALAQDLWSTGILDARVLASMVDDPAVVTEEQMESWVRDFDSWALCDQCCNNLFGRTGLAYQKAVEWTGQDEEFVKRAGFVLMAVLAVHDKGAEDEVFCGFLPLIKREAVDERNYVQKAMNWALRQIGKRNRNLNQAAIETAKEIQAIDSKSARWIASDALRELTGEAVQKRLRR